MPFPFPQAVAGQSGHGGTEIKAKKLVKADRWWIRRYHLENQQALSLKLMLYHQWKQFIANLKSGMSAEQAIDNLQVSDRYKAMAAQILAQAASNGVNQARAAVQEASALAAATPNVQMPVMSIDWALVNEDAKRWAQEYAYSEISGITATTCNVLRQKVGDWVASGEPLQQLMRDRKLVQMFGPVRARMIAVTEVTRAYAEANQMVFQQIGVPKRRWNTANDELVCPTCAPLNGVVVGITEPFPGGISLPPAHPNCRCWITPVMVEEPVAQQPAVTRIGML